MLWFYESCAVSNSMCDSTRINATDQRPGSTCISFYVTARVCGVFPGYYTRNTLYGLKTEWWGRWCNERSRVYRGIKW